MVAASTPDAALPPGGGPAVASAASFGSGSAADADEVVWRTDDHRYVLVTAEEATPADATPQVSASRRDAPPESGNFDGGYVATAVQVTHYAAFVRDRGPGDHPAEGDGGA